MAKRKTSSEGAPAPSKPPAKRAAKPRPEAEPVKKSDAVYQLKITLRDITLASKKVAYEPDAPARELMAPAGTHSLARRARMCVSDLAGTTC